MSRAVAKRYPGTKFGTAINVAIHKRGFDLWRSGLQPKRCRTELGLTSAQWRWLVSEGSSDLPSYESMLIEEVATLRTEAREAAKQVSTEGVEALKLRVQNARAANAYSQLILRSAVEEFQEKAQSGQPFVIEEVLPSKHALETLKVLAKLGELGPSADAFKRIYGDVAAHKALYPERDNPRSETASGEPLHALQGEQAERDDFMNDETMIQVVDELRGLTPEQLRQFVEGGDEPMADPSARPTH